MASTRAADIAEILWELKVADKVATYSSIAQRAGFSAGSNGRAVLTALKTVRRDWSHLQWWRAVPDECLLENGSEQQEKLQECGYEFEPPNGECEASKLKAYDDAVMLSQFEQHLMDWNRAEEAEVAEAQEAAE